MSATFFCLRNEKKGTKGGKAVVFLGKKARIRRTDGNLGVEMRRRAPDLFFRTSKCNPVGKTVGVCFANG